MKVPSGLTTQAEVTGDVSVECGAVIVGSGAGGATMAAELAEAGVDVVVIEEGGYHPTSSFRAESVRALRTLYRDGGGGMTLGRPSVLFAEGRCVGGSTVINGGMSWRTPGRVLEQWSTQEDVQAISEQDMEPFFARAEARHSVGWQDPETIGRDSELLKAGAEARAGLRSASGQLGRNLSLHPNANVTAFFDSDVTGWHGVHQAFQVWEFMSEGLILTVENLPPPMLAAMLPAHGRELGELMADYNRVVTGGPLVADSGNGRVRSVPGLGTQVFYRLTDATAARLVRGVELTAEALFTAGARRVLLPFDGAPEVRGPEQLRNLLARPVSGRSIRVYSIHLMGTARMSEDPRRGVTDSYGAVHGVPRLFVTDASLFPGPTGINPMETVIAVSMRNAHRLLERRDRYGI